MTTAMGGMKTADNTIDLEANATIVGYGGTHMVLENVQTGESPRHVRTPGARRRSDATGADVTFIWLASHMPAGATRHRSASTATACPLAQKRPHRGRGLPCAI